MKIIALQAENIKRLIAVEIRPDSNLVEIKGKNGAGKTSVLDSIWWALAGTANIQERPIRQGAESARIRLDLGEIIVTRNFKPKNDGGTTSSLIVENAEGARFPSPQTMLDDLLGALSFDPLAFARASSREQFDALRKFVPDVDFDAIERADKLDYAARAERNRSAKEARAAAAQINVPDDLPMEAPDEAALVDEITEVFRHNANIERHKATRERAAQRIADMEAKANDLREQADRFDKEAKEIYGKLEDVGSLPDPVDTAELRARIESARKINAAIRQREQRGQLEEAAREAEYQAAKLTDRMDAREAEKRAAIEAATLPIYGLGFGDGEILLNGLPIAQASDAEQLRVSLAIAMALNPKLRVIRVRDGSLLDADSMKAIAGMADEQDYQLWVERVDGSGNVGFVIEDGKIKEEGRP